MKKLTGKRPCLKHIKGLGCAAFVYNEIPKTKLHFRPEPTIFLECDDNGVFNVGRISVMEVWTSVCVTFDGESSLGLEKEGSRSSGGELSDGQDNNESDKQADNISVYDEQSSYSESDSDKFPFSRDDRGTQFSGPTRGQLLSNRLSTQVTVTGHHAPEPFSASTRKLERKTKQPACNGQKTIKHHVNLTKIPITKSNESTVEEEPNAIPEEPRLWCKAIKKEIKASERKSTWYPVQNKHQVKQKINSYIVLKIKRSAAGQAKKFKTRVVAGGHRQVFKQDFGTLYAPVVSFIICLLTLIIAFTMGWFLRHLNVIAALFRCKIDSELCIEFPCNVSNCKLLQRCIAYISHHFG